MHCTNCGTLLPEGAKFCTNCGTPTAAVPVSEPQQDPVQQQPPVENAQEPATETVPPTNASAGYKAASAQLPPSYSNPNYSSQARPVNAVPAEPSNGFSIAGFVCSLVFWPFTLGALTAVAGLILSIIGLSKAKQLPGKKGHGLAMAGTIISAIRIAFTLILIVAILALMIRGIGHVGHEIFSNWSDYMPYAY